MWVKLRRGASASNGPTMPPLSLCSSNRHGGTPGYRLARERPLPAPFPPFGERSLSAQLRRSRPRSATSAIRQLRPSAARDPMIRQPPEGRKFPQEPAGSQDSERCTLFDKYPRRAAVCLSHQHEVAGTLEHALKIRVRSHAHSSISEHEGEPSGARARKVFVPPRRRSRTDRYPRRFWGRGRASSS